MNKQTYNLTIFNILKGGSEQIDRKTLILFAGMVCYYQYFTQKQQKRNKISILSIFELKNKLFGKEMWQLESRLSTSLTYYFANTKKLGKNNK